MQVSLIRYLNKMVNLFLSSSTEIKSDSFVQILIIPFHTIPLQNYSISVDAFVCCAVTLFPKKLIILMFGEQF